MYVGALELDVLLGDVHSLKQKRSVVRPVIAELRRRFEVAAAEAGHLDLHRRALSGCPSSPRTRGTCARCSTAASGSWRRGPSWSCCRPGAGCWVRTTTSADAYHEGQVG